MQVMTIKAAVARGLHQTFKQKLHPQPPNTWRPTLTKEQEDQQKKDIEAGRIPF